MELVVEMREVRFEELARAVGDPLRRYVVRRADPAIVDDVLADTFLVLWRRLDDVPDDDPLPWCYAVAHGCLANQRRSAARQLRLVEKVKATTTQPTETPEHDEVLEALATLGELDREVVQLWAWEGLAPREIAAATGLTPNAVSIRLHRAKKKLLERLGKDPHPAGQEPGERRQW